MALEGWEALHHKDGTVTPINDSNRDEIINNSKVI